jgi:hypothetical protein
MKIQYALVVAGLAVGGMGLGCQDVEPQAQVLTQDQWNEVKANILTEEPTPKYKSGAIFGEKIELIGYDIAEPLEAGKPAKFTWYWRALADGTDNWKAFIHLDSEGKAFRQNLDHVPVKDLYATSRWKKGQIIKDEQTVTLRRDFPAGDAVIYLGFFKGNARLKVTNDVAKTQEAQPRVIGATVKVKGGAAEEVIPKPKYNALMVPADTVSGHVVDGKLDEAVWATIPPLTLRPLGNAPNLPSVIKTFVTPTHLYMGAKLDDSNIWGTLKDRDSDTWTEEVLEMFLDFNGDGKDYLELQITPNNVVFDAHFENQLGKGTGSRQEQIDKSRAFNLANLVSAVQVDGTLSDDVADKSWTVEFSIPLAEIPGFTGVKAGDTWALNFYRFDRPEKDKTAAYAWSTGPRGDFHQVDKFGEFHIVDVLPAAPLPMGDQIKIADPKAIRDIKIDPTKGPPPRPTLPATAE